MGYFFITWRAKVENWEVGVSGSHVACNLLLGCMERRSRDRKCRFEVRKFFNLVIYFILVPNGMLKQINDKICVISYKHVLVKNHN